LREIRIIVTDTAVSFLDGKELGRIGEHNATQLIIELPAEMLTGIDYHIIKFSLLSGPVTSDIITEDDSKPIYLSDGKIYCALWQQLTASRGLSFTVEAYKVVDGTPKMIAKSPLVSGLRFEMSTEAGAEVDEQGYSLAVHVNTLDERIEDAESDIDTLQTDSHTHTNKSALDGFSSIFEGVLPTYQDRIIPTQAVDTDYDDGTLAVYKAIGVLTSAENTEGQPLNVSDIVGTIDKAHEHLNKSVIDKLTEGEDGNPLYDGNPIGGTSGDFIPLVSTLPDDAENGDMAYVKATYSTYEQISSELLTGEETDYFNIDFTDGWDSATLAPTTVSYLTLRSAHSGAQVTIQLADATTAQGTLGDAVVAIVAIVTHGETTNAYIYTLSDAPTAGLTAHTWYTTEDEFATFTPATQPDIGVPYPFVSNNSVTDYAEFDKVFNISRETANISGLYRYIEGAWMRLSADAWETLAVGRVESSSGFIKLDSNALYLVDTTDAGNVNIYVIMPESVNEDIDNSILLNLYCDVDRNLIFDETVNVAELDTTAGYHEILMTYHAKAGKWWVRQTSEEWI
jgi:hypothetical protein